MRSFFFDQASSVEQLPTHPLVCSYTFTEADIEWFHKQPGCTEIKVETEPGDLVLWDSRTVHWNRVPTGEVVRNAVYVCMCPKSMASAELLDKRKEYFENRLATSHWCVRILTSFSTFC